MLYLNFKIALRRLLQHKILTAINILGLSVGLTGFMLILVYINFERSYDSWNPLADQVYRISVSDSPTASQYPTSPGELAPALQSAHPEIESYGRIYIWDLKERLLGEPGNEQYINHIIGVDSTWFELFPYHFIYGDASKALKAGDEIILSSNTSKRFFGDSNPVGKTIKIDQQKSYKITGVYASPASPEHLENDGFIKASSKGEGWGNGNFYTYLKLAKGTNLIALNAKINKTVNQLPLTAIANKAKLQLHLLPVRDIYLKGETVQDMAKRGSLQNQQILLLVSGLLLFIACLNFTNLSIAQSAGRAMEIGIRKVMGAHQKALIIQFLTEIALQCVLALFLAWALSEICLPYLNQLMGINLYLYANDFFQPLMLQLAMVLITVTLVSGGYTAYFISGFQPSKVLKGDYTRSTGNMWFRKGLIVSQFAIAGIFISVLLIMNKQVEHMKNQDPGFNAEQVMVFKIRNEHTRKNFESVKQRLKTIAGVQQVGRVNYYPGIQGMQVIGGTFDGLAVEDLSIVTVDADYFEVMGMQKVSGDLFTGRKSSDEAAVILNEAARDKYGLKEKIGQKWIMGWHLNGVVKNHIQKGMESTVEPIAFAIETENSNPADHVVIKLGLANLAETVKLIEKEWQKVESKPFEFQWLDQRFQEVYLQYIRLNKLFNIFTVVALFVAILGLFAMAKFITIQRTREIGIRKVLGADHLEIVKLINKELIGLILIANCIAAPLSFWFARSWLNGFVYRTDINGFPFLSTLAISIIVSTITISLLAYRASRKLVVKALKYE